VHPKYTDRLKIYNAFQHTPEKNTTGEERKSVKRIVRQGVLDLMDEQELSALVFPTFNKPPVVNGEKHEGGPGSNSGLASEISFPAISVPMGFTKAGLPMGLQIMARPFEEKLLLQLAFQFEQLTKHRRAPDI
jgi:Asp-tRNA(Asn)/Glu-tRNA(Gln) amidotransferase A subunit family amidase